MSQIAPRTKRQMADETRQRLLDAADRLCRASGPMAMSLDAVAAAAGLSKGGLLYHFPSKHALLRALVEHHVTAFTGEMDARTPDWRRAEGAAALAAVRVYLSVTRTMMLQTEATAAGIFAALTEDPLFMTPLLALRSEIRALFGRCPPEAMLLFLASEGIFHDQLIDPEGWSPAQASADLDRLTAVLDRIETAAASPA